MGEDPVAEQHEVTYSFERLLFSGSRCLASSRYGAISAVANAGGSANLERQGLSYPVQGVRRASFVSLGLGLQAS